MYGSCLVLYVHYAGPSLNRQPSQGMWWRVCYVNYDGCRESIQPLWISREPVELLWCNMTAIQRKPYCSSVNSHTPVGLVSRQWDAIHWACVMCDRLIHNDRANRSASSWQCACPFYTSRVRVSFFLRSITSTRSVSIPAVQIRLLATSGISQC